MEKQAGELQAEVDALLARAEARDAEEDGLYGKGRRGDEWPEELRFKQSRLARIQEAKRALEQEARAEAQAQQAEYEAKKKAWDERKKRRGGRPPKPPSPEPEAKRQRNFTDPDSRIMPVGRGKTFLQGYNCQAAVDEKAQVIVATDVTQQANDKRQLEPMVEKMRANTGGQLPSRLSADSGYFSEANVKMAEGHGIDPYIAPDNPRRGPPPLKPRGRIPKSATCTQRMARKLRTVKGRSTYSKRKHIAEAPFGQIKEARGLRRFSLRGLGQVSAEWDLICLGHNLLKLFRHGPVPAQA